MQIDMAHYYKLAQKQADGYSQRFAQRNDVFSKKLQDEHRTQGYHTISDDEWFTTDAEAIVTLHDYRYVHFGPPSHPHNHDFFEMSYVYKGQFYNRVENQDIEQKENTLVLLSPRAVHSCYIREKTDIVFNILIKRSLVEKIFLRMFSEESAVSRFFLDSIYNIHQKKPYLVFHCNEELVSLVHGIIREHFDQKLFSQNMIIAKLIELFSELSRLFQITLQGESPLPETSSNISEILDYIENNYSSVTLTSVAEHFNYSPSYVSRIIKTHLNQSFASIVHNKKLENACRYLSASDLPVEQVIEIVGYSDVSHFYKIFKQKYGLSPRQYRTQSNKLGAGRHSAFP